MDRHFPEKLKMLHQIAIDYEDGIDFEPYEEFVSSGQTDAWIKLWTCNQTLSGDQFLIFGQDGSGGYAAFWLVNPDQPVLEQPVVFFGSEGEAGLIAANFYDYVWLLANGIGPFEAIAYPTLERQGKPEFARFAQTYAHDHRGTVSAIIERAHNQYPEFDRVLDDWCA
ncbi:SMI1/KNR4 family protein [Shewanella corallii]|uniref:SMI1/KNR4 family protein n=2 Tax=Shewanella TaxID=22 RepID=A0ABT0NC89_9GAMM|nr:MULTISPECIES: SMI1/KNR4 family protein [Shewanella]MCL1038088.1 SMI1/KNR4 family protein [Shewanella submarina]MCL2916079.1 SMI1/KNR4 family protein [Shewanella corallii]